MDLFRSKTRVLALVFAVSICLPLQSRAAYNVFLSIAGIPGPATNNQIVVAAYSFGLSNPTGRASFQDLAITKALDITSPVLALDCANGRLLANAVLTVVHPITGNALYTVTLNQVSITSDQVAGSTSTPSETITLHYTYISWTYQQLDGSGNPVGSPVTHYWNVATNSGG